MCSSSSSKDKIICILISIKGSDDILLNSTLSIIINAIKLYSKIFVFMRAVGTKAKYFAFRN